MLSLIIFIKQVLLGTCTGISFVDSTPLRVCCNQRILIHKIFEDLVTRGKCSTRWFFGFKLHLVMSSQSSFYTDSRMLTLISKTSINSFRHGEVSGTFTNVFVTSLIHL